MAEYGRSTERGTNDSGSATPTAPTAITVTALALACFLGLCRPRQAARGGEGEWL